MRDFLKGQILENKAKTVLVLKGGQSTEHEVSLRSAEYLVQLLTKKYTVLEVFIDKNGQWFFNRKPCSLRGQVLHTTSGEVPFDVLIPNACHGIPGETGHLQAMAELFSIPYIGPDYESCLMCFNKGMTKLWLKEFNIPVVDSIILTEANDPRGLTFFDRYQAAFVKASNQGSSVGCYPVKKRDDLEQKILEAFQFSDSVLLEELLTPREFEISVYEFEGQLHASHPAEIHPPQGDFYSYKEKYDNESRTGLTLKADLANEQVILIQSLAKKAFKVLGLSGFCRVDFFISGDKILFNEVNTLPGMTSISQFPKMIEENGHSFADFLSYHIEKSAPAS